MAGQALYYPYLSIRDPNWLKSAILYWEDGISRITPAFALARWEEASPDIVAAAEAGLVSNASPFEVLGETSSEFLERVGLLKTSGFTRLTDRPAIAFGKTLEQDHFILVEKMAASLRRRLLKDGLAHSGAKGTLELSAPVMLAYMTVLARHVADRARLPLVSDAKTLQNIASQLNSIGAPIRTPIATRFTVLGSVRIGFPSPDQLSTIPMAEIIAFNQRNKKKIRHFREFAESRLSVIMTGSAQDLRRNIRAFEADLADEVNDYGKHWRELGVTAGAGLLDIAITGGPEFVESLGEGSIPKALGAGLGSLLKLGVVALQVRHGLSKIRHSPASYVLALNRRFGGR